MAKYKTSVFIITVCVFIVGLAFAQEGYKQRLEYTPGKEKEIQTDLFEERLDFLTTELDLAPEQREKIKEILAESTKEIAAIRKKAKEEIEETRGIEKEKIKAFLTQEQKEKFQGLEEKRQRRLKKQPREEEEKSE
jgi:3-dehydroquinate dehydratase